jgi:hypothetical protein
MISALQGVLWIVLRKSRTIGVMENTVFFTKESLKIADAQRKLPIPT